MTRSAVRSPAWANSSRPFFTTETAPIEAVAQLLVEHDVELLPVVREGRLVGIVGRSDVLEAFVKLARKA